MSFSGPDMKLRETLESRLVNPEILESRISFSSSSVGLADTPEVKLEVMLILDTTLCHKKPYF